MADRRVGPLRATAHPLRLQMLSLLTGAELSAAEVARELGISHANASYHLRTLHRAGRIVVAGEERIRGGVAKRYRYVLDGLDGPSPDVPTGEPSPGSYLPWVRALCQELERRIARVEPGRPQLHADIETWVAPEVWQEACGLLLRASRLLHEAAQPPRTPGTRHVSATVSAFGLDDRGGTS